MANSAFTPAVLTVSGSSSTSSGEKNYVTATDGNASGLWVASGVTVATSTSTIPDNITKASSLAITWTSGTTGYARYRFTLDQADYGKKFKIQWDQIYGTAGHWTLQVYSNTASDYTGTSTQLTVQTSAVPGITGTFTTSVDMPGSTAPYIEIRIVASSTSATTIYLNSILMGPGTITQGAAISEWQTFTVVANNISSSGTNALSYGRYRRIGSSMELNIVYRCGSTGGSSSGSQVSFNVPDNWLIDTNIAQGVGGGAIPIGVATWYDSSAAIFKTIFATWGSSSTIVFNVSGTGGGLLGTDIGANQDDRIAFTILIPISQWAGSGTVSLGAGAQVEWAYNTSGITAAGASNTTSFAYGPAGAAIGSIDSATASQSTTTFRIQFQYAAQTDDLIFLEFYDGTNWFQASDRLPWTVQNLSYYGARVISVSSTQFDVQFGNGGIWPAGTFAATGNAWSGLTGWRWRVRKAKASSPVGFGKADSASFGLVGPRKGQQSLTVTSTIAGWATTRAVGVYYQDQDGNHRLKFNMRGQITSTSSAIAGYVTMSGVTVKSTANFFQAFNVSTNGSSVAPVTQAITDPSNPSSNHLVLGIQAGTSVAGISISGDIELDSKPSWA